MAQCVSQRAQLPLDVSSIDKPIRAGDASGSLLTLILLTSTPSSRPQCCCGAALTCCHLGNCCQSERPAGTASVRPGSCSRRCHWRTPEGRPTPVSVLDHRSVCCGDPSRPGTGQGACTHTGTHTGVKTSNVQEHTFLFTCLHVGKQELEVTQSTILKTSNRFWFHCSSSGDVKV